VNAPVPPAGATRHKTLIIHIGDHKTGSTSIQETFAKRQVELEQGTIFYPAKISHNRFKVHFHAYKEGAKPLARKKAAAALSRLAGKIDNSSDDFCLISAEAFETVPPAAIHEIVTTHFEPVADEIRIIAYVRPHAARLLSSFTERSKIGRHKVVAGDLESFYDQFHGAGRILYHPRFSALKALFGDRFTLRPMIRGELYQGSVVTDFIRHAFGTEAFRILGGGSANESLDLVDLMRLKLVQEILLQQHPGKQPRQAFGWEFARVIGQMPPPPERTRLRLHRALAERLHAAYLEDARALDRDFFGGAGLMEAELAAALDSAVPEPQSVDPADYLAPEEIRAITALARIISDMLTNNGQNWQGFLHDNRYKEVRESLDADRGDT